jgi:hypothetical protein
MGLIVIEAARTMGSPLFNIHNRVRVRPNPKTPSRLTKMGERFMMNPPGGLFY